MRNRNIILIFFISLLLLIGIYNFLTFKPPETKDYYPKINYSCRIVGTPEYENYQKEILYPIYFENKTIGYFPKKIIGFDFSMRTIIPLYPPC